MVSVIVIAIVFVVVVGVIVVVVIMKSNISEVKMTPQFWKQILIINCKMRITYLQASFCVAFTSCNHF